jgi:hypothetical protein
MSSAAGEVYIDITARLADMEKKLKEAEDAAAKSGEKSGKKFKEEFGEKVKAPSPAIAGAGAKAGYDFGDKFGEQAKGVMGALAGPMIAATLAKAVAGVMRSDKSMPDAILDAVKTIPFVGAFADLGSAIYDATFGAADKAAEDLVAEQMKAAGEMAARAGAAQQLENKAQDSAAAMVFDAKRLSIANELIDVRASGDKRALANAEYLQVLAQQAFEMNLLIANDVSEIELNAFNKLNAEKQRAAAAERDQKLKDIDDAEKRAAAAAQKEMDAQTKLNDAKAKTIADREQAAARDVARASGGLLEAQSADNPTRLRALQSAREKDERMYARQAALRDSLTEKETDAINLRFDLEERTAALKEKSANAAARAANATGSASTALGSFTFDAYPATEQRTVQNGILTATQKTAEYMQSMGIT